MSLALPLDVWKEARALLPVWAAALGATLLGGWSDSARLLLAALTTFTLASITLGAWSIGHEFGHRTLGLLLAQPARRTRHFAIKTGVLAALLLTLGAGAWAAVELTGASWPVHSLWREPRVLAATVLSGLFLAPALTLLSRSALGGIVFSLAVPGMLMLAGILYGERTYGRAAAEIDRLQLAFLWNGMLLLTPVAALSAWFLFSRLEALDGGAREFQLPAWLWRRADSREPRPVHPLRALAAKELRLQQITFVVSGLYVLTSGALIAWQSGNPDLLYRALPPIAYIHLFAISALAGAMAIAEERRLGVDQWQLLLPVSNRRQWLIKAATVFAIALGLTLLLPAAILALAAKVTGVLPPESAGLVLGQRHAHTLNVVASLVLFASTGLYLSSLTNNGVRALVFLAPVLIVAFATGPILSSIAAAFTRTIVAVFWQFAPTHGLLPVTSLTVAILGSVASLSPVVAVLLHLSARNHRLADPPPIGRQILLIILALTGGLVVSNLLLKLAYGMWRYGV